MSYSTPKAAVTSSAGSIVTLLLVPLVTIVGLVVLMALHDVDGATAIPIISLIAGVHGGAAVANASGSTG